MPLPTDAGVTGRAFTSDGSPRPNAPFSAIELERVISLPEVSQLTGLSEDSLRRHYAHLISRLSPRRVGMKLRNAITIGTVAA
jgi:hypothetical protein